MATTSLLQTGLLRALPFAALLALGSAAALPAQATSLADPQDELASAAPARDITITYRTHDGHLRHAYLLLPAGHRAGNDPALPPLTSPHGPAVDGKINPRPRGHL